MDEPAGLASLLPPRPRPVGLLRPDFSFIDVEASSFHEGAYPVEIGISGDDLGTRRWLLRPAPDWTLRQWSLSSEAVHRLDRDTLRVHGEEIASVADALNEALSGKSVFSDAPEYDGKWLARLYDEVGKRMSFELSPEEAAVADHVYRPGSNRYADVRDFVETWCTAGDVADLIYPHVHVADHDARRMAAAFRMTVDAEFFEAMSDYARTHAALLDAFATVERSTPPTGRISFTDP